MPVEFPTMRLDLISVLEALADDDEVRRAWIDHDPNSGLLRGGWLPFHVFAQVDDLARLENPHSMLGVTLRSTVEIDLVARLSTAMDLVIASSPVGATDEEIAQLPEWPQVAEAARELAREMTTRDLE